MNPPIKVLVVDDASFLRKNLPPLLESAGDIKVVGTAATGYEGVELAKKLRPDVITLDVVMPSMGGLEALKIIMREAPTPVVMISSRTYHGAAETVEALTLGAVDYIPKPSGQVSLDISKIREEIITKVRNASRARVKSMPPSKSVSSRFTALSQQLKTGFREPELKRRKGQETDGRQRPPLKIIGIAASTGGPMALQKIFSALPAEFPIPICVVQHIGPEFVPHMINRFNSLSDLTIKTAEDGEPLEPGTVYFSPRQEHLTLAKKGDTSMVRLQNEPSQILYRPSGNELLWSLGANFGPGETCGVVLTGMGDDGALGLKRIRESGGHTIAQDEKSCVVFGMPKMAIAAGGAREILPLDGIINRLMELACSN